MIPATRTQTLRRASLTGGLAIALMAVLAPLATFGAVGSLVTPGEAERTAQDILASEGLFRWGVLALVVVVVLDIIAAAALLTLFTPVNRGVSTMAAWFRVTYGAVYLVAILQLVLALDLLDQPEQALSAIEAFNTIWLVALILFAVHLLLIGYLAYRSGFMAKIFGILLVVAGLGYLTDGIMAVLVAEPPVNVGQFTFVGEVSLILWLLIVGRRKSFRTDEQGQGDPPDPLTRLAVPVASTAERSPAGVGEPV